MIGRTNAVGGSGDIDKSQIFVTAPTGSKVTCSNNLITKNADEKNGKWRFTNLDLGEWKITADKAERHKEDKINISRLSIIYHDLTYFDARILVTTDEGVICTCTNGKITLNAEKLGATLYGFTIPEPGIWTVIAEKSGDKVESQVSITADKQNKTVTLVFDFVIYQVGDRPALYYYRQDGNTVPMSGIVAFTGRGIEVNSEGYNTFYLIIDKEIVKREYSELEFTFQWNGRGTYSGFVDIYFIETVQPGYGLRDMLQLIESINVITGDPMQTKKIPIDLSDSRKRYIAVSSRQPYIINNITLR